MAVHLETNEVTLTNQSRDDGNGLRQRYCPSTTMAAWDFTDRELREAINGERLLCPSLDLSNACNLNCPYCFTEPGNATYKKRRADELDEPELYGVIEQMAAAGARTINIIGAGEPLLDPRFERIARFIQSKGIRLLVATNGCELVRRPNLLGLLRDIGANVIVKMNSLNETLEDAMVGHAGYAGQRDQALALLLAVGFNHGTPSRLGVNTVITTGNRREISALHQYCRLQNIVFIAGSYMPAGRTGTVNLNHGRTVTGATPPWAPASPAEIKTIGDELREWDRAHGYPLVANPAYTSGLPCVQSLGLYVDVAGKVWPCSTKKQLVDGRLLDTPLGMVRGQRSNLGEIFRDHPYMKKVRAEYQGDCPYKKAAAAAGSDKNLTEPEGCNETAC